MVQTAFDVVCIGNAIFDILSHIDDDFLHRENLIKGSMRLISSEEAEKLYDKMGSAVRISGGSAGNTASGIASFSGRTAFIGKVANDEWGKAYRHDMQSIGIHYDTPPLIGGAPTARSLICITPDGERTMNTYLGACQDLTVDDIKADIIQSAKIVYLEGYLWDPPHAKTAFRHAANIAHAAGRQVALTLSDSFCVDRYRDEFLGFMQSKMVDIIFANEHEIHSLYQTSDFDIAIENLRSNAVMTVITLGEKGAMVINQGDIIMIDAYPVSNIVDLTGAGDLFAAGFLFALARNLPLSVCGQFGSLAAAEIITHIGARPERSLANYAEQNGLSIEKI